jgi:glycosyltransferase involved in cell wall biosynthesis
MERLLGAVEKQGHQVSLVSTNGYQGMEWWTEERAAERKKLIELQLAGRPYDMDVTYTIPTNFPKRFLKDSRVKVGRYDYESSHMPDHVKHYWSIPDWVVASSHYVADIFVRNGAPANKVRVVNSGIDPDLYRSGPKPTDKLRFLCVAEAHYRKQLDLLLETYCARFTSKDPVTLILKTNIFKNGEQLQPYQQDLRPTIEKLKARYGANMPSLQILSSFLTQKQMADLYKSAHVFVLPTAAEGWCMPYLEALGADCLVIAPKHGGQLDFLTEQNSLLVETSTRPARPQEQYGCTILKNGKLSLNGYVGNPNMDQFGDLMRLAAQNYSSLYAEKLVEIRSTASTFTWDRAALQLLSLAK